MSRDILSYHNSLRRSQSFCGSQNIVGFSAGEKSLAVWQFRMMCDRWECPHCGPIKAKRLRRKMYRNWGDKTMRHLMLSCNASAWDADTAYKQISDAWDILLKRLRRQWPRLTFFKALEFTAAGYPHLHILLDTYVPQHYLSRAWSQLFRSPYVYIKSVGTVSAVRYVTAYASKWHVKTNGFACLYYLYKLRRFSHSKHFFTSQPQSQKWVVYRGRDDAEAKHIFEQISRELASTYRIDGSTPEGDVLFFNSTSDPPAASIRSIPQNMVTA